MGLLFEKAGKYAIIIQRNTEQYMFNNNVYALAFFLGNSLDSDG